MPGLVNALGNNRADAQATTERAQQGKGLQLTVALNADSQAPKDAKVLSKPFHLRDLVNEVGKMLAA